MLKSFLVALLLMLPLTVLGGPAHLLQRFAAAVVGTILSYLIVGSSWAAATAWLVYLRGVLCVFLFFA